ncbi:MAG: hypothetical protein ABIJ14_03845 [Nanoarchaeota archaeon]
MIEYKTDEHTRNPIKIKLENMEKISNLEEQIKSGDKSKLPAYWTEVCNLVGGRF